jgi:hypothetical protein
MNLFKRRQFLRLFGLAAGASVLPIASRAISSTDDPLATYIAQAGANSIDDPFAAYMRQAEAALREEFKGITTDGQIIPNLYSLESTGISTKSIKQAADSFIAALNNQQQAKALFPVNSIEWRRWSNIHRYPRNGISFLEMTSRQKQLAFNLLRVSLSAKGFEKARDIMTLNQVLAQLTNKPDEYGQDLYWFSFMGHPSMSEPWGWQFEGHHLTINYFVLGDQVVMTPTFMGSEPVMATEGEYAGTRMFELEESKGLAAIRALTVEQREKAILAREIPREVFTTAFRDNFELHYEGISFPELMNGQQELLLDLIGEYVGDIRNGHAEVKMEEVRQHLESTYFAWMGGFDDNSVFYYRIHSPVVLIEFDHQGGQALGIQEPSRNHIHTVVRTPNGNDYGKDLLRQHYEQCDHSHLHSH